MPVDISRKVFGCTNVGKTWSERSLFRIIKGDNEDIVNGLGDTELLGFMEQIRNTEIGCGVRGTRGILVDLGGSCLLILKLLSLEFSTTSLTLLALISLQSCS